MAAVALRFAFAFNIAVLLPVVWSLYADAGRATLAAFDGKVANVDALRLLVAALWCGMAVCSAVALWQPHGFVPLLIFQVVYKSIYLLTFAWPAWRAGGTAAVPLGVTGVFLFIVLTWPMIIAAALREGATTSS